MAPELMTKKAVTYGTEVDVYRFEHNYDNQSCISRLSAIELSLLLLSLFQLWLDDVGDRVE